MTNTSSNLGSNIKALREQSGFTQMNVARYLGVDQSMISKIEKNERVITLDMLERLSSLFGVESECLYMQELPSKGITFALRASEINEYDMKVISDINGLAMNIEFMTKLKGDNDD